MLPLDADNILLPDCLQRCLQVLTDSGATVAYPTIREFEGSDGLRGTEEWKPPLFAAGNYVDAMALVRKAAWVAVGGYQSMKVPGWEDYDFWCRFVEYGFWGVRVPEVLAHYRVHQTSMLHTQTDLPDKKELLRREMHQRHPWLGLDIPHRT